jgi:hypothetical protein
MKEFFAFVYDTVFGVWNEACPVIFSTLYNESGYIRLGLLFILVPLVLWALFYYAWRYPYGRFIHWLLWLFVTAGMVFVATWITAHDAVFHSGNQALQDALADPSSGYREYAGGLPPVYAWINTFLATVLGFIYSLVMKQFSKIQMHLPF